MAVHTRPSLRVEWIGQVPYQEAWNLQRQAVEEVRQGGQERLYLLEHPHVYTSGRRARPEHLLVDQAEMERLHATHLEVDRGGDITYHGPGQLVGYPIIRLGRLGDDLVRYLRLLEAGLIATCAAFGVETGRLEGCTGVWAGSEKLAAIGVKVSAGITSHGFALNVNPDLSYFGHIVPCGITDKGVTSMERLLGRPISLDQVRAEAALRVARALEMEILTD
ncbi:MAG: lipoyl(octanoyl) transferase LipB [Candidatus Dormibacteria bacterium]